MKTAFIGIGTNLGDLHENCNNAIDRIGQIPGCGVSGISQFYLTEPVGVDGQGWYRNGVLSLSTNLPAQELLQRLLEIETDMGRTRSVRWESRIIDLDLLIYSDELIEAEGLIVPHPRMHQRRFVMIPMVDLAPNFIHPLLGKTMDELLQMIPGDCQNVEQIEDE